ncbi:MAG: hypothetical protein DMG49_19625 [Acidobacteria bacterium]|nr:MAG: hypothetical protein DMG49_19625 [Acidobacteriota bacterium]
MGRSRLRAAGGREVGSRLVPLALITLSRALAQKFDRHRRIARWTLPIWL